MKKNIKIMDVLLVVLLVVSNLMIGSPLRYNIEYSNLLINIVAIIYFIVNILKKREIELNRFDLFVIGLSLTTFIPLLSKSYIRLAFTVEYVLRYMTALNLYLIIKQYIRQDRSKLNIIINVISIMSVVSIVFGIDMMTKNAFAGFYEFIKVPRMASESSERMISIFKYPNSFCVYIGVAFFITLGAYLNNIEEKEKNIKIKNTLYSNVIFMQLFAIAVTYSRLGWIIIFGLLVIYTVLMKEKCKQLIKVILIAVINAFVYFCLFNNLLHTGNVLIIWGLFAIQNIIQYIVVYNLSNITDVIKKIDKKVYIAIGVIVCIGVSIWYILAPSELILFNSKTSQKKYRRSNVVVEANTEYNFKFNITANSNLENNFKISIKELNEREELVNETEKEIDKIDGEIDINITTNNDTKSVSILFKCIEPNEQTKMTVHSVKMNDKEIKVYYKLLPIALVTRIEKIKLDSASVNIRMAYIKQAIKVVKTNPLLGSGGYAWRGFKIENVNLTSVAEHCYPLQLFMQNGIIAIWIYMYIIIMIIEMIIKLIKNKEKNVIHISFLMSLLLIIMHSLFDFDMYFQVLLLEMYICFAAINKNDKKQIKRKKLTYCLCGIMAVVVLYLSIGDAAYTQLDIKNITESSKRIQILNSHIAVFPYDYHYYYEKLVVLINAKNKGFYIAGVDIDKEIDKCIEFIENIEKLRLR